MRLAYIISLLGLVLVLHSCIEEIDFESDSAVSRLTVEGQISDSLMMHGVRISNSVTFEAGASRVAEPVSGATVKLFRNGQEEAEFVEDEPGEYTWYGNGNVGDTYQLQVVLADGSRFESTPHVMPEPTRIGSLEAYTFKQEFLNANNVITESTRVGLDVSSTLVADGMPAYAMYRIRGEYEFQEFYPNIFNIRTCYISEDIDFNVLNVFAGEDLPANSINSERIFIAGWDYKFFFNYCFHVEQYTIDEETYEYWSRVEELVSGNQTVFTPPPGTIRGNMYSLQDRDEEVLGFFTVASLDSGREFFNTSETDETLFPLCMDPVLTGYFFRPEECFDCLLFNNSTLEKPEYWR